MFPEVRYTCYYATDDEGNNYWTEDIRPNMFYKDQVVYIPKWDWLYFFTQDHYWNREIDYTNWN